MRASDQWSAALTVDGPPHEEPSEPERRNKGMCFAREVLRRVHKTAGGGPEEHPPPAPAIRERHARVGGRRLFLHQCEVKHVGGLGIP